MFRSATALCALILATASVNAADLGWSGGGTSPVFSSTPAAGWSGFYAGISGGYGWGTTTVNPALAGGTPDNNSSGWNAGAQAGYNLDLGGFVVGAEADISWANIGFSQPAGGGLGTFEAKTDLFGTARARAGFTFGQVMPYATVGAAFGRGSASLTNGIVTSQSANHLGWTAGVGIEAQATETMSVKAEYLYVDLGSQPYAGLPIGNRDITQRFGVVRAGINYRF